MQSFGMLNRVVHVVITVPYEVLVCDSYREDEVYCSKCHDTYILLETYTVVI
jgi:hypothetical protein